MPHDMQMYVVNRSNVGLLASASHTWDTHTNNLQNIHLVSKWGQSSPIQIKSGYGPERDIYNVNVVWDGGESRQVSFSDNSSQDQNAVVLQIFDSHVCCLYYTHYDGSIQSKGIDSESDYRGD